MKTAMQDLIDRLQQFIVKDEQFKFAIKLATELLEKEKQQIIDAYKAGCKSFSDFDYTSMAVERESNEYYNETFTSGA